MIILLYLLLMGIPSVFPAVTTRGRFSLPPTVKYLHPRYVSSPLFQRISRSEIPRTIFLKNLLELDCIRQMYNQNKNKKLRNRYEFFKNQARMSHGPLFRFRGNNHNNRMPGLMRQNQIQGVSHPFGEGKFVLTPISYSTGNFPKSANYSKNWRNLLSPKNFFKPNLKQDVKVQQVKQKESNIDAKVDTIKIKIENGLQQETSNLGESVRNNTNIFKVNGNHQTVEDKDYTKIDQLSDVSAAVDNSSYPNGPLHLYHVPRPKIIQPYEVEEIIEENISVDVKNEKDNDLDFDEQDIYDNGMELLNEEPETTSQEVPNNMMEVLDNSINKILKGLIQPPPEKEKPHKEVPGNKDEGSITTWIVPGEFKERPFTDKNKVTITPPFLSTTLSRYFSKNFRNEKEKFNKAETLSNLNRNSDNRAKSLILQNEKKNTTHNTSFANEEQEIWRLHPVESKLSKESSTSSPDSKELENVKNPKILEEKRNKLLNSKNPSETESKLQLTDLLKFYDNAKPPRTEPLPSLPELFAYSIQAQNNKGEIGKDNFQLPNLQPNDSLYGQTFSILPNDNSDLSGDDVMPITTKQFTTEKNNNKSDTTTTTTTTTTTANAAATATSTTTTTKVMDRDELPIKKDFVQLKKTGLPEWDEINIQSQLNNKNRNEKKNLTEFEQTAKETTKANFSFDLTPATSKSEINNTDVGSENSRKMHYGKDLDNFLDEMAEQRRSDILINEALNEYDENLKKNFPSTYLKALKENISEKNFSINSIVPNIFTIINDIRGNNLSPEEIRLISRATGKYWPSILALSNNTNFDMLPLLKMRNEKDLEKFLENSVKEENVEKTTLESVYDLTSDLDYGESLDYDYDYKDMYQDITVEDLDFKRKKKFRPVREAGNRLQHLKTKKAFFYGLGNGNIIEETESHIRIKRNKEDHDWKAEATREYFGSLEKERNENAEDYWYDEILYSDLADDKELIQAELVEASNLQVSFQNLTSSLLNK